MSTTAQELCEDLTVAASGTRETTQDATSRTVKDADVQETSRDTEKPSKSNTQEQQSGEIMLDISHVSVTYEGKPALTDVSFSVPRQGIFAIMGPSGCGKSTLLRCINGLIHDDRGAKFSGTIFLGGKDTASFSADELRRRIGLVFQTPAPFPFSIKKNIAYAPKYYGVRDRAQLDAIVERVLKQTGLWDEVHDDLNKSALKLSGGQQQRLCIARALTVEPDVLLLDEPCSALDVKSSAVIEQLLLELKKTYTIVIVTHNLAQARRISDHAAFLYNGRLIETGQTTALFTNPQEEETKDFLGGVFG